MKKVIVACGNGVATSQTVAFRINRMLEKRTSPMSGWRQ